MKATITRTDGTRIEAEGTPEEIARLAQPPYVPVQACTCWAGSCPLHSMYTTLVPRPGFTLGTLTSNAAAAQPTRYWIATV